MIALNNETSEIGSKVTVQGKSGIVVGTEDVGRGDALRRPQGRNLLIRLADGSDVWQLEKGCSP